MITRKGVRVAVGGRTANLPPGLPMGCRVRLGGSRESGVVIRAEQDRGGIYVVVRLDRTGGFRCIPPDRLVPAKRRRKRRAPANATGRR